MKFYHRSLFGFCLLVSIIGCNSSNDSDDRRDVTCVNNIGVNLPASAAVLIPENFDPAEPTTFTNSTTYTAFDIFSQSYLQIIYFIKTDEDTWLAIVTHDNVPLGIKSPASGLFLVGAELLFDEQGAVSSIFPEPIDSEDLILRDDDFIHHFEFRFDEPATTQLDAAFSVNLLESGNCFIES